MNLPSELEVGVSTHTGRVRIANGHRVVVFARDEGALGSRLASSPALADAARPAPAVVACPGTRWCSRALVDTNAAADRLREALAGRLGASGGQ